jgi:hypothetical protein
MYGQTILAEVLEYQSGELSGQVMNYIPLDAKGVFRYG